MHAGPSLVTRAGSYAGQDSTRAVVLVAATLLAVFAIFATTVADMVAIWIRSETYNHCFLVLPAALWMIWQSRERLSPTTAQVFWPGAVLIAAAGGLWLLGALSSAAAPMHFAVVGMAVAAVVTLFGLTWSRVLLFPLSFLFFAVPFGEVFVPQLIDWTADFTVTALRLSGTPVLREGNHFTIPTGRWSVVEACSGVRYLIASLMTGTLYAWLMYRSTRRRVLFMAAAGAVPIFANWLRAYVIVMLGHFSDNAIATGVDHLVYGWAFFGAVMFVMFAIGARWREDHRPSIPSPRVPPNRPVERSARRIAHIAAVFALVALWPLARSALLFAVDERPLQLAPLQPAMGWTKVDNAPGDWRPSLQGPRVLTAQTFAQGDSRVLVVLGIYRGQRDGAELVNSQNLVVAERDAHWSVIGRGENRATVDATVLDVRTFLLRRTGQQLQVWHWYWLGERSTASDVRAKLDLALDRLRLRSDTSAWVAVAAEHDPDDPERARALLGRFLSDMGKPLDQALRMTASR